MKHMNGISCVIPVYNEGRILYEQVNYCLKCLENDFDDYELILVDDGSTDSTAEVIRRLVSENSHIVSLPNHINLNMGISVQRGFFAASKEYVTFNAVDLPLDPRRYKSLVALMDRDEVDLLVIERKKYLGTTKWRKITSKINGGLMFFLFPKLKKNLYDTNYTQIIRKENVQQLTPLAKSPIFTWPEMIFRARLLKMKVRAVTVQYNPRVVRKGAFGKPNDIIWGIYDMLRFRLRMWANRI